MRILVENLPRDIQEDEICEALRPFAPVERVSLIRSGGQPAALIEMEVTRVEAQALALRIDGYTYRGQRLHAWVPVWDG